MDKIMRQWLAGLAPQKIELNWQNKKYLYEDVNSEVSEWGEVYKKAKGRPPTSEELVDVAARLRDKQTTLDNLKKELDKPSKEAERVLQNTERANNAQEAQELIDRFEKLEDARVLDPKQRKSVIDYHTQHGDPEKTGKLIADILAGTTPKEITHKPKSTETPPRNEPNKTEFSGKPETNAPAKVAKGASNLTWSGFGALGGADLYQRASNLDLQKFITDPLGVGEDAMRMGMDMSLMAHGAPAAYDANAAMLKAGKKLFVEPPSTPAPKSPAGPNPIAKAPIVKVAKEFLAPFYGGAEAVGSMRDLEQGKPGTEVARRAWEAVPFVLPGTPGGQRGVGTSLVRGGTRSLFHGLETEDPVEAVVGGVLAGTGTVTAGVQDYRTIAAAAKAAKAAAKAAEQAAVKSAFKAGAKQIPGLNLALAVPFAATRAAEGDWSGAGLELAGAIPFVGIGAEAYLGYRDVQKALEQAREQEEAQNKLRKAEVKDIRELMPPEPGRPVRRRDVEKLAVRTGEIRALPAGPERETEEQKWERRLGIPSVSDEKLKTAQTKENPETFENAFKRTVFEHAMRAGLLKK